MLGDRAGGRTVVERRQWKARSFTKKQLFVNPYESATVADLNRDGHVDIVYGAYWLAGPDFVPRAFRPNHTSKEYLRANSDHVLDVDKDGWPEQTEKQGIAMAFDGHRGFIAAPDLSDGTMFTLGLLCVLRNPRPPKVLCVEEPETGLHPRRLRWLFDHFLQLAYAVAPQPSAQVIQSTHSPYIVDLFSELQDAVQIVEQRDGRAQMTSMSKVRSQLHEPAEGDDDIGRLWSAGLFEKR